MRPRSLDALVSTMPLAFEVVEAVEAAEVVGVGFLLLFLESRKLWGQILIGCDSSSVSAKATA